MSELNTRNLQKIYMVPQIIAAFRTPALAAVLSKDATMTEITRTAETIAAQIEAGCYAQVIKDYPPGAEIDFSSPGVIGLYSSYCYKVLSNLESIFQRGIPLDKAASVPSAEINPDVHRSTREELELRMSVSIEKKISMMYRCGKCGGKRTTLDRRQTRAADEDSTLFITCVACGHRWTR